MACVRERGAPDEALAARRGEDPRWRGRAWRLRPPLHPPRPAAAAARVRGPRGRRRRRRYRRERRRGGAAARRRGRAPRRPRARRGAAPSRRKAARRAQTRRNHSLGRGDVLACAGGARLLTTREDSAQMTRGDTSHDVVDATLHSTRRERQRAHTQAEPHACDVRSPLPAPALQQRAGAQEEAEDGGAADGGAPDVAHFEQAGHLWRAPRQRATNSQAQHEGANASWQHMQRRKGVLRVALGGGSAARRSYGGGRRRARWVVGLAAPRQPLPRRGRGAPWPGRRRRCRTPRLTRRRRVRTHWQAGTTQAKAFATHRPRHRLRRRRLRRR